MEKWEEDIKWNIMDAYGKLENALIEIDSAQFSSGVDKRAFMVKTCNLLYETTWVFHDHIFPRIDKEIRSPIPPKKKDALKKKRKKLEDIVGDCVRIESEVMKLIDIVQSMYHWEEEKAIAVERKLSQLEDVLKKDAKTFEAIFSKAIEETDPFYREKSQKGAKAIKKSQKKSK
jgi:hypothetical protein